MKKILLYTLASLSVATFMTACGQNIPYINTDTEEECQTINKKLVKVDTFTKMVNETSAFHLEEAADAVTTPGITASNNKKKMLRDAKKRKTELQAEQQKLGCETVAQ
jgi:hypothetical protein